MTATVYILPTIAKPGDDGYEKISVPLRVPRPTYNRLNDLLIKAANDIYSGKKR